MSASDFEQELADSLAEEINKTISFEIISEILISSGWTRFDIDYGENKKWCDVLFWVDEIATDEYKEHAGVWLFKDVKDALMFKLRWT